MMSRVRPLPEPHNTIDREAGTNFTNSEASGVLSDLELNEPDMVPFGYIAAFVVIFLVAALTFGRRGNASKLDDRPATPYSGFALWQPFQQVPNRVANQSRQGGIAGVITATLGFVLTLLAVVVYARGRFIELAAMQRVALVIAATGQATMVLGILLQLVYRSRALRRSDSTSGNNSPAMPQTMWPSVLPVVPLSTPYSWPVAMPVTTNAGHSSGQIAQLKAQLNCLSQQLDHLSAPPPPG
jgi:hypothetical protein